MSKKFFKGLVLVIVLTMLLVLAAGCGSQETTTTDTAATEAPFKVAFIYYGSIGDHGWTYQHEQGRIYLQANATNVETIGIENVAVGADAERVMTQLAQEGYNLIVATSFDYQESTLTVAKNFPDVMFMNSTGDKSDTNVMPYFGREYESFYLDGVAAGLKTESNILGYIASYPIPAVIQDINAFAIGARSVNPDVTVKVVMVNTWYDPAAEKQAADSLIDGGADVLAHETDSAAPHQAAEARGVWSVGKNSDMDVFAPDAFLTGGVWNWGPFYADVVNQIREGKWDSAPYWGHMSTGILNMAPYGTAVTDDMKTVIDQTQADLFAGNIDIFAGPLKDQAGTEKVAAGSSLTDDELRNINWVVDNVKGNLGN